MHYKCILKKTQPLVVGLEHWHKLLVVAFVMTAAMQHSPEDLGSWVHSLQVSDSSVYIVFKTILNSSL